MRKTVIRRGTNSLAGKGLAQGMLRGVGGAALAGIGWKLGMDLYEALKRRLGQSPSPQDEQEPPNY